jgi:hypothetical protein
MSAVTYRFTAQLCLFMALFDSVGGTAIASDELAQELEMAAPRKAELMQRLTPIDTVLKADEFQSSPNNAATTLLSERITIVDDQGRRTSLRHVAYRSLNDAGAKENSEEVIPFRKKEQTIHLLLAETIQTDGTHQPVKPGAILIQSPQRQAEFSLYDDQAELKIIFPNVKPGSVTHMVFSVEDVAAKIPGEFTQSIVLRSGWNLVLGHYQVELPTALSNKLRIETIGNDVPVPAVKKLDGGRVLYTWDVRNQQGKHYELNSPPAGQVGPTVNMGTLKSWDDIARWYRGLIDGRNTLGPVLAKAADGWTKGMDKSEDVIKTLHRNVADQIRYVGLEFGTADYQPHNCNEVWENQYGDCKDKANLLVALLGHYGIRAYIALVNTEHAGLVDHRVPTYSVFDHAIVAIARPGATYLFCDPTIAYSQPGDLGPGSSDRGVLILKEASAEWIRTPAASAGSLAYQLDLKLANSGELSGWLSQTSDGFYGAADRARLMHLESDDLKEEMTKTVRGFFPGADLIDVSRSETAPPTPFSVKGYFIVTGKPATASSPYTMVFPATSGLFTNVGDNAERETAFYTYKDVVRAVATISLPIGWHPAKVPDPFENESDVILCRAHWRFQDGMCNTEITIETKRDLIKPSEFKSYYQSLLALHSWLSEPVLLTTAAREPTETGQFDLAKMPSGSGQIELVDKQYPEEGDSKKRTQALMRTMQFFPEDKKTVFRAGGRLAVIDWNAGRLQDAHDRLKSMLARYSGAIDAESAVSL